ncbi:MAG: leucine-rich repeat protein [Muribaculaceae bacterium]|nr:leucine-rich repeat protein [Muribaculaceae bacterium]
MSLIIRKIYFCIALVMISFIGRASDFTYDNLPYTIISFIDYTCSLDRSEKPYEGNFVVPESVMFNGINFKVTQISGGCFSNSPDLISVDLSNGAIFKSSSMFKNCVNLRNVVLNENQTTLPEYTFYGCSSLTSFDTGPSIKKIEEGAFANCNNLEKFTIGVGIDTIDTDWFESSCPNLKEIYIKGCSSTLVIAAGLKDQMAESKYNGETQAVYYTPLFYNLPIEKVYIGRNLTYTKVLNYNNGIQYYYPIPFSFNKNIKEIEIGGLTQYIKSSRAGINKQITEFGSFIGCSSLINVNISSKIFTKIEEGMFRDCTQLSSLILPNCINEIDDYAFYNCASLTSFEIPEDCKSINMHAFSGCSGLNEIQLNDNLTSIGLWAFQNCDKIKKLTLPSSLQDINEYAIDGMNSLEEITFNSSITWKCNLSNKPLNKIISNCLIPPTLGFQTNFTNSQYINIEVLIPYNTLSIYKESKIWQNFMNIHEMNPILCEQIILNIEEAELNVTETLQLEASILPANTSDKTLAWTSSNEEVASVSEDGLIVAITEGEAIITASCGDVTATCKITVVNPVVEAQEILLNFVESEMNVGKTLQLEATVLPEDVTDPVLIWTSSNENIAAVSERGLVTAISAGEAIITATCGEVSAECVITVLEDAGVEILLSNPDSKISVYSIDGVLIKKDCKVEDLKSITKGIYIIVSGKDRYKISI